MKIFLIICILGLSLTSTVVVPGKSSVWEVKDGANKLYLVGSCHVLRASDFPLPKQFEDAYIAADSLIFETDLAKLQDPMFAMKLMQMATYENGKTLKSELSPEVYASLSSASTEVGFPLATIERFKPGMAIVMLTMQALIKHGATLEGVDVHYHARAIADGKSVVGLETVEFQSGLMVNLGMDQPDAFVRYSLEELDEIETQFLQLITVWKSGDVDQLESLFVSDLKAFPKIYNDLLRARNLKWLPKVEKSLKTTDVEMVVVGAAHLVGDDGLVALLLDQGYTVTQLP